MKAKIFFIIILFLNISCRQNKDTMASNENTNTSFKVQWDQLKAERDKKKEKNLVVKFIKLVQEKNYGIANPTYVNYNGKTAPLSNLFDDEKPDQLKGVNIEILDRKGIAPNEKLGNWKPLDYKSAMLFLQE
ncbi:hypothetical protein IM793_02045 [Pedobacter sp. MR2016-19]|uniref:hypothetical protein n=1 Tax=Pedobacter sp. MR2016-19 TaxID=2780089 RepID=UPI001877422A|nr:hypothetical protein [Pedobacter sp. MR2016-19]MBE5317926.1 hypothetical protein [Pedobacter sp. MR2016-19]